MKSSLERGSLMGYGIKGLNGIPSKATKMEDSRALLHEMGVACKVIFEIQNKRVRALIADCRNDVFEELRLALPGRAGNHRICII